MERDQALKFMHDLLRLMTQKNGSDLFITANFPPAIKVDGRIMPVSNQVLSPQHSAELARAIMNDRQAAEFESTKECNFAISPTGIGRFRVNALVQQGRIAVVLRTINMSIPTIDELGLPVVPTVPFLIVSAWAASKGWPAFEIWLLNHRLFGPPIVRWRERGAVPRSAKWYSTLMMGGSAIGMQFFAAIPLWLRIGVPAVMLAVAIWLWLRPEE